MLHVTASRTRWVTVAAIAGGAVLAIALAVRAAGTSGTDPPASPARQQSSNSEEQRELIDDTEAARKQLARPQTNETITDTGDGSKTQVKVNGESITVPANGSYDRTTDDGSTRTQVHVDNRNQSTETGNSSSNHSSSNIRVNVRSGSEP